MLAIIRTLIHGEDALKTLTVLEQPVLPVELKATLELAADFRQGVDGACDAGGPAGVQPPQRRLISRPAIDAVLRLGTDEDRTHSTNRPALDGSSTILHSSTFWERKWDSTEN
jgi:hypothetical protein